MIEFLRGFAENVLAIRGKGRITKTDYDTVLIPAIDNALKRHDKIRFYYEIGPNFDGFERVQALAPCRGRTAEKRSAGAHRERDQPAQKRELGRPSSA
jgi:hypothetical protein